MFDLESAQFVVAFLLAGIAVATYWVNRRGEMRDLAGHVYVERVEFESGSQIETESAQRIIVGPVVVSLHNAAATPIQNMHVYLFDWGSRSRGWRTRRDPKTWWTGECRGQSLVPVVRPESTVDVEFPSAEHHLLADSAFPPIVLVFTDGRGAQWVRFPDGRLKWRAFWQPPYGPIDGVGASLPA